MGRPFPSPGGAGLMRDFVSDGGGEEFSTGRSNSEEHRPRVRCFGESPRSPVVENPLVMPHMRLIPLAVAAALAAPVAAAAQIHIQLLAPQMKNAQPAAPPVAQSKDRPGASARQSGGKVSPAAKTGLPSRVNRAALQSRSMPRQIGVARRQAGAPQLPAVGAAFAPEPPASRPTAVEPLAAPARLGRTLAAVTDVYRMPDPRSPWICRLAAGQQAAVTGVDGGWVSILMSDGTVGYVLGSQIELLEFAVHSVVLQKPEVESTGQPHPSAEGVIAEAFRYEGVPYRYGGNGFSGIDCSGLVKNCFASLGISLPRTASQQAGVGQPVPLDQLQPGDRLYFSVKRRFDHTGIYIGNGEFIHAASSRRKVTVDRLGTALYARSLEAARR